MKIEKVTEQLNKSIMLPRIAAKKNIKKKTKIKFKFFFSKIL